MKKKILIILSSVIILSMAFVAFSETIDELKERFVTRDEWAAYVNSMASSLSGLEQSVIESVNNEAKYQAYKRDIFAKDDLDKLRTSAGGPETIASWDARKASEATNQYQY